MTMTDYPQLTEAERDAQRAEVVRRGKEIYETSLRNQLEADNVGRYLLIETATGAWEMFDTKEALTRRLHEMPPGFTRYLMQIGFAGFVKRGGAAPKPLVSTPQVYRNGK